jgi:glycosyltransferase involved in cell wall biosynthesis
MTTPDSISAQKRKIIGLFPELLGIGGIQEAGRMTAAALVSIAARKKWPLELLSLNDSSGPHSLAFAGQAVSFRGFGRSKLSFIASSIAAARRSSASECPVIFSAHPYLAVPANVVRRFSPRSRSVVVAHGVEVWEPLPGYRRRALVRTDLVVAPSRYTVEKLISVQRVAPERAQRLPWPLSPSFLRLAEVPANLPVPAEFPRNALVILTVGRWASSERYKGADDLIRAVAQIHPAFPNARLVAVGGGDDLARLRTLANELQVADRVHFLESLTREQIAGCYAQADIFALPSTGEGFGLVFLEAMAFSKAVVGAAAGGATDVIQDGENGLMVPPGDPGALAQALSRLLGDESLRKQLGRRAAEIVRQKYRFDGFQAEVETILESR